MRARIMVGETSGLARSVARAGKGKRVPWIGFDDVGVSYPSSTFRTDVQLYEAVDSAWAAIRTKCSVISLTMPLIDRLSKNIGTTRLLKSTSGAISSS